ncbi:putative tocopherol O-methyltransferase, chloroplastic [Turnera subulata]|uniref:Tocopherol O-methyltransferase, chloroplastic n=1 Tax=Turnera subulata TaxID=218843 RepID=A0A9Q0G810_9ROSI|nr:putative tocopherol O-methyltransferase, chloroplastic [Turnera subulata]
MLLYQPCSRPPQLLFHNNPPLSPPTPPLLRIRTTRLLHSRASRATRVAAAASSTSSTTAMEVGELKKGIAELYDQSSGVWEDIWGDHMHHGFYDPDETVSGSGADHRAAQIRMIQEALRFAGVPGGFKNLEMVISIYEFETFKDKFHISNTVQAGYWAAFFSYNVEVHLDTEDPDKRPKNVVDVGCGIGGSSRYLARKYGAKCVGITLSPIQADRANALAAAEGLAEKASFQVADALEQPFPDGQFDLVWSMESGEHMPDKRKFVTELARVAAPGATIIIVTWCHRDLGPSEKSLQPWEKEHLKKICNAYYLPEWCSTADYVQLLESLSLEDIKAADWSQYVAPFWPAVIRSALSWKGITSLLRSGLKTIRGALVMPLMIEGYKKDLIKFAIITCRKPE